MIFLFHTQTHGLKKQPWCVECGNTGGQVHVFFVFFNSSVTNICLLSFSMQLASCGALCCERKTMTQQWGTWICGVLVCERERETERAQERAGRVGVRWGVWRCACDTVLAPLCNTCTVGIHVPRPDRGQRSLLVLVCHWLCMPQCSCMSEWLVFICCACVCVCVYTVGPDRWGPMLGD